jgi:hypothetical protein
MGTDFSGFHKAVAQTQEELAAFFAREGQRDRARAALDRARQASERARREAERLRREGNGWRSAERAGELGEERQVGVKPDAI